MSANLRRLIMMMQRSLGPLVSFVTSATGTTTVSKPGGINVGDYIFIIGSGTSLGTWTPPSGFLDLFAAAGSSAISGSFGGMCVRIATGSEASSFTYGGAGSINTLLLVFRGVAGIDNIGSALGQTATTSLAAPAATASFSTAMLLAGFTADSGVTINTISGMTQVANTGNPPASGYYQQLSASGSTGTRTATTSSSTDMVGGLITLSPTIGSYASWSTTDRGTTALLTGLNNTIIDRAALTSACRSTTSKTSGKPYFEWAKLASTGEADVGIATASASLTNYAGFDSNAVGWDSSDGHLYKGNASVMTLAVYDQTHRLGFAVDVPGGTIQFLKNNTSLGTYTHGLGSALFIFMSNFTMSGGILYTDPATQLYSPPAGFTAGWT